MQRSALHTADPRSLSLFWPLSRPTSTTTTTSSRRAASARHWCVAGASLDTGCAWGGVMLGLRQPTPAMLKPLTVELTNISMVITSVV